MIFPPCPYLPEPLPQMDAGVLTAHGSARDSAFYLSCLTYGAYLWERGLAGRAILKLDRALGADLQGNEAVLQDWPLPYKSMAWFLTHATEESFVGNPRVHFQHFADRMNEPRREQRRWRAWACWYLTRQIRPHLPADPKHIVEEPTEELIAARLEEYGHPGEVALWRSAFAVK